MGNLIETLSKDDLATSCGMVSFVGYTGWSTYGGYGPLAGMFGLGFEQILAAKIVDWRGETVEVGEDLMRGIRGAGGTYGVIVEMTIKVYPLKHILTGILRHDTSDVQSTVKSYCSRLQKMRAEGFPPQLCVAPLFFHLPDGLVLASHFMWADKDEETGHRWLDKVSKLGKTIGSGVRKTTLLEGMKDFDFVSGQGSVDTISLRKLSDEVTDVIAKHIQKMPRQPGNGFAIHVAPRPTTSSLEKSVFATSEAHLMLGFLYGGETSDGLEESRQWANNFLHDMKQTDQDNILQSTYISLTPAGRNTLKRIYGANYPSVVSLKDKYDPHNVFKLAVPFCYLE
ncbi:uncharacterized protein Z518_05751 [Rhinocladiella mackenziei CBS 650.93]|uniref:Rhinocladiella mackenziei CBS 650.93 unplaced genomic scaffold supercont1.4, whole genome shotgun sequence n=1 Tax=Rhinocladiella mackenziei CBS 650.93 TaxID=1442369 RepID=A0A0D2J720_9EURO|nr:uncharacterized protein Z518_05751 [Rhinocladiella mackenziei CBS 650.93]KIX04880.1 hypothetical protein Z518_05751 [Rhinocladiella mackenziei CBS 650.93]